MTTGTGPIAFKDVLSSSLCCKIQILFGFAKISCVNLFSAQCSNGDESIRLPDIVLPSADTGERLVNMLMPQGDS